MSHVMRGLEHSLIKISPRMRTMYNKKGYVINNAHHKIVDLITVAVGRHKRLVQ